MCASHQRSGHATRRWNSTAGKSERRLVKKIKGVTWGIQGIPHVSRRSRRLGRDSCNHRFEQLMVHFSFGPPREPENRVCAVPDMPAHPSKCELGVV